MLLLAVKLKAEGRPGSGNWCETHVPSLPKELAETCCCQHIHWYTSGLIGYRCCRRRQMLLFAVKLKAALAWKQPK
jgi:hypothetical protein